MVDYKRFLIALCLLCSLPSAASAEDKFMRFLGWLDAWLEKGQRQGIDTNYIEVPKLNRQVYIGQYTYYQNYDMTMPFSPFSRMSPPSYPSNTQGRQPAPGASGAVSMWVTSPKALPPAAVAGTRP